MDSVQKGLRNRDIEKDTYERLLCAACGETLERKPADDDIGVIRYCEDCGREWRDLP